MTAYLILACALSVEAGEAASATQVPLHIIRKQVTSALQAEAKARTNAQKKPAVESLARLYARIQQDERYETSDTLKQLRTKIWSRLDRTRRRLRNQLAREGKSVTPRPPVEETLATVAAQIIQMPRAAGGPTALAPLVVAGRGGGATNFAQELIVIIERTISPQIWAVNGGPASMAYYPPVHALVVRATDEVHFEIAHLLTMLRAAGGP